MLVTDAPFEHDIVEQALIRVDQIRVHASQSAESGWHTIYAGEPLAFDLLDLRNGVTRTLVNLADVPAGHYGQLRLRVHSGYLRLTNGDEFSTADGSLNLTSTDNSGFKVMFDPPILVRDGFSEDVLLDFDLTKTFRPIPASDPLSANSYKLHPVIRSAVLSGSGELRGLVTKASQETLAQLLVPNASIYLLHPGETDPEESIVSTSSDSNGGWMIIGLAPGNYDLFARKGELSANFPGVVVNAGSATEVRLELE
ncbi:MAG: hypothetical protein ACI9HE_001547 [Planctomycetota bacterium]